VTIPRGIQPGQTFPVLLNGQQVMVRCPPGSTEGDRLIVTPPPRQPTQSFVVTVPSGVRPGDQFRVSINQREVLVTCPPNVSPNQRVTFHLPRTPPTQQHSPTSNTTQQQLSPQVQAGSSCSPTVLSQTPQLPQQQQPLTQEQLEDRQHCLRFTQIQQSSSPSPTFDHIHRAAVAASASGATSCGNSFTLLPPPPPSTIPTPTTCPFASSTCPSTSSSITPPPPCPFAPSAPSLPSSTLSRPPLPPPSSSSSSRLPPSCAAPNHQMFEVTIPHGVHSGQSFALLANGQRVMVTCPLNILPGQKIRFQLPIKLTRQQLDSVRVDYHKDGWIRCLGSDLNFHWVFNHITPSLSPSSTSPSSPSLSDEQQEPLRPISMCERHLRQFPDLSRHAYVRHLTMGPCPKRPHLQLIDAASYSMPSTVPGTKLNYQEISSAALSSFDHKCAWLRRQFQQIQIPILTSGYIKLRVRREHLLQDSLTSMDTLSPNDYKKTFRVEFIGEAGLDAGGLSREWYTLLTDQLLHPNYGLFQYSSCTSKQVRLQINPNSGVVHENHLKHFYFLGHILGKSLMDGFFTSTSVRFITPLYKFLLGYPLKFQDLAALDHELFRHLLSLLTLSAEELDVLALDFTVTVDRYGAVETVSLLEEDGSHGGSTTSCSKVHGAEVQVCKENVLEYLLEQCKYRLFRQIQPQLTELLRGFSEIVPEPFIAIFNSTELELLLHGMPHIDLDDWKAHTEYSGEFLEDPTHQVIRWWWEIVEEYSQENRVKLLQFSTGTSGVPPQGFRYLQSNDGQVRRFTLMGSEDVKVFPRSHTCFNRIDLPLYTSKEEMKKFLTIAITMESTGFELE
jgi:hypothetical protein